MLCFIRQLSILALCLTLVACSGYESQPESRGGNTFTIAVIPDTQNMLDYKHQKAAGFAIDSDELFIQQMQYIADRSVTNGGDIVFAASVGDVWQHQTQIMDEDHRARGFQAIHNPYLAHELEVTDKTFSIEIPKAIEGYQIIAEAGLPFGVAPGNHDYDSMWSDSQFPPNLNIKGRRIRLVPEDLGMLHIGGLNNFRSAFGDQTEFFRDKPWYVNSFNGGANSAQLFSAGGYQFLHIALEMQPPNEVLEWAESVLREYHGLPTVVTTHDYLSVDGERAPIAAGDLVRIDPENHNSSEDIWQKLIAPNDQIFLVLCGHQHGQAMRIDENESGNEVYQILADYQDRGQAGVDAGQSLHPRSGRPIGIGDGWFRLMTFDFSSDTPSITVKTYSSFYQSYSGDLASYAQWYKSNEKPDLSDAEFLATDNYVIPLTDFYQRFKQAAP